MINIIEAITDHHLFGQWFRKSETWASWRTFLSALFALPLNNAETVLYRDCTGRTAPPSEPFSEAWLICGRRAGKSFTLALIAVFLACFKSYSEYLGPGERATVVIIATDRRQARVIFRFIRGFITGAPLLASMVERETSDSLDLNNQVTIEVATASFRTTRGYTFAAVMCDELAFWPTDDSAEPDYEVLDAIRPGMATIPGAILLCASSPYAKRGALFDAYRRHWGKDDAPVLVWKRDTLGMNPTVPKGTIEIAYERDAVKAAADYGANFRNDREAFVALEAVEAVIAEGVIEREPLPRISYVAFVDPSGGSSDSMTLAIAHVRENTAVLDMLCERMPPFSPEAVVSEFASILKRYRLSNVRGDRYAGEWPRQSFMRHGVSYITADHNKSELYGSVLPLINSGRCDLLDHPRLVAQFCALERRTGRGRDIIDHPSGHHDDVANAVAGVLVACASAANAIDWLPVLRAQSIAPVPHKADGYAASRMSAPTRDKTSWEDGADELLKIYEASYFNLRSVQSNENCEWCGKPIAPANAYNTDGEFRWHIGCPLHHGKKAELEQRI